MAEEQAGEQAGEQASSGKEVYDMRKDERLAIAWLASLIVSILFLCAHWWLNQRLVRLAELVIIAHLGHFDFLRCWRRRQHLHTCLCLASLAALPISNQAEHRDQQGEEECCQDDGEKGAPEVVESHAG
jgi:hypothetical protein